MWKETKAKSNTMDTGLKTAALSYPEENIYQINIVLFWHNGKKN